MNKRKLEVLKHNNTVLINFVIGLIGIIAIIVSFFITNDLIQTVFISVGCSLLASAIVSFLFAKYLVKASKIKTIINSWALESIYQTRQEMNLSCDEKIDKMEKSLDIIAWGLKSFRDCPKSKTIKEKVKKGVEVRILAPDPETEFVKQREKDEGETKGQIKNTINGLQEWVKNLKEKSPDSEKVQIKFYKALPEDFYFRVDDCVFVGPYLYNTGSQQTISYEYKKGGKGYEYYKDYFESLWEDNTFLEGR